MLVFVGIFRWDSYLVFVGFVLVFALVVGVCAGGWELRV